MSEPLNPDLGQMKLVLEIDGHEHVLAFEIFHVVDFVSDEPRTGETLAPIVWGAFEKVIGDARENIGLWGMHGLIDAARAKVATKT